VDQVLTGHGCQVPFTEDQDPVQEFAVNTSTYNPLEQHRLHHQEIAGNDRVRLGG
jgi:hypothetical protein